MTCPVRSGRELADAPATSILLTLLFIQPLTRLMLYAAHSDLDSHILLVPLIAAYLLYLQRGRPLAADRRSLAGTVTDGRHRNRDTGS